MNVVTNIQKPFTAYSPEELSKLREEKQWTMPLRTLMDLQGAFRGADIVPNDFTLSLLEYYYRDNTSPEKFLSIENVEAEKAEMAVWADLWSRIGELNLPTPLTLETMAQVANRYLERAGKPHSTNALWLHHRKALLSLSEDDIKEKDQALYLPPTAEWEEILCNEQGVFKKVWLPGASLRMRLGDGKTPLLLDMDRVRNLPKAKGTLVLLSRKDADSRIEELKARGFVPVGAVLQNGNTVFARGEAYAQWNADILRVVKPTVPHPFTVDKALYDRLLHFGLHTKKKLDLGVTVPRLTETNESMIFTVLLALYRLQAEYGLYSQVTFEGTKIKLLQVEEGL